MILLLITLVIISTFYDWQCDFEKTQKIKSSKMNNLITCFSLLKSHKILFRTSEDRFECIDSIRFLATILMFLAHYYLYLVIKNPAGKGILDEDGVVKRCLNGDWKYLIIRNWDIIDIHFAIRFVVGD